MTRKEALEYLKHRFMETGSPLNPSWESLEELKRHYGAIIFVILMGRRRQRVKKIKG